MPARKKAKVYLLGSWHSSSGAKRKVSQVFDNHHIDLVICEGAHGAFFQPRYLLKNPFLLFVMIFVRVWAFFLNKRGTEFDLAGTFAKKHNTPVENMDVSMSSLYAKTRWWDILVGILFLLFEFVVSFKGFHSVILSLGFSLIFMMIVYSGYYLLLRMNAYREKQFVKNIKKALSSYRSSNVLILAGKLHASTIKKNFSVIEI